MPRRADGAPLPVTVLTGFLGAGKTTLLRRLLREQTAHRMAVIINDLSELAVDVELMREAREDTDDLIIDLHHGSLGGALREPFRAALDALAADPTVTYLVIETSGGTHPDRLVAELAAHPGLRLDTVATVVDGLNLLRDHAGGRALLTALDPTDSSTRDLLRAQIDAASLILVAKADRLTRPQAESMLALLHALNPRAAILTMAYGRVPPARLIDASTWRPRQQPTHADRVDDDPARFDLDAVTLRDPRPMHPTRLYTLFRDGLPLGVHRSKGWLWLASRPLDVFVWHQAGSQVGLEWAATWKAGILEDPAARLIPEERAALTAQVQAVHPTFGDRHCELTIIGHTNDRTRFAEALAECLCTDEEVAAWQRGDRFDDPWPRTLRQV